MPPVSETDAVPFVEPHAASFVVRVVNNSRGSVKDVFISSKHPTLSVTVTEYEPALNPLITWVVSPLLHI